MQHLTSLSSVGDMISWGLAQYPRHVALIEVNRDRESARLTYQDFEYQARSLSSALSDRFHPGEHAAILMSNQSKWLLSATAVFWSGGTLVPLDYKLTPKEQSELLIHSESRVLFIEYPIYVRWKKEGIDFPPGVHVIVTETPEKEDVPIRYEALITSYPKDSWRPVARSREDIACIVYSSGTGGTPKGCMMTHGNYLSQAMVLGKMFPIRPQDRYFSVLPTNHAIDFMCGFLLPLQFGSAIVHQRTLRPEFLASTMKTYGITHMALVPLLLKAFEQKIRSELDSKPIWVRRWMCFFMKLNHLITSRKPWYFFSKNLFYPIHKAFGGKLRLMFAGGAFVDAATAEFFYSLGLPVVIGYGLTEAGTVITVNDLNPFRSDTVGKPIHATQVEIRALTSKESDRQEGEIWVKGPTIMKGYFKAPDLTQETLFDGWLKTGDIGFLDHSGHLKLLGRSKNMIVTQGGKNIYPEDIEAAFESLEGSQEICVFSSSFVWKETSLLNEKLVMVVRPKEATPCEKIIASVRERNQHLADFKRVSAILLWEKEFPRTASMKIKRQELAEQLRQQGQGQLLAISS